VRAPVFIGSDVFLSFLVRDVERRYKKARDIFRKAEAGRLRLETTELVLAEVVFTLRHDHDFTREETREVAETILNTRNLRVRNHPLLRKAVELYGSRGMEFTDAYNVAYLATRGRVPLATVDRSRFRAAEEIEFFNE